jgi:hypothetical protein
MVFKERRCQTAHSRRCCRKRKKSEDRSRRPPLAKEVCDLQQVLAERDSRLAEAQKAQAAFVRKQRELDDAKREQELTVWLPFGIRPSEKQRTRSSFSRQANSRAVYQGRAKLPTTGSLAIFLSEDKMMAGRRVCGSWPRG